MSLTLAIYNNEADSSNRVEAYRWRKTINKNRNRAMKTDKDCVLMGLKNRYIEHIHLCFLGEGTALSCCWIFNWWTLQQASKKLSWIIINLNILCSKWFINLYINFFIHQHGVSIDLKNKNCFWHSNFIILSSWWNSDLQFKT